MSQLSYKVIEPQISASLPDALLIMPNEIAAGLKDYHGARAQDVANVTGMAVLAYERPLSAGDYIFSFIARRRFTNGSAAVQAATAKDLNKAVDKEGPKKLYIAGHSAGATEAIGIVASDVLQIEHGIFTDPPGLRRHAPIYAELVGYGGYQLFTERKKPADKIANTDTNARPEIPISTGDMLHRTLGDISTYSAYHRSDSAFTNLEFIAKSMPRVGIDIILPEYTFNATPAQLRKIANLLSNIRDNFNVDVLPGQYHSYFNDYHRFGTLVRDRITTG